VKNVRFDYMYRDRDNYKRGGEVVFANPEGLDLEVATARLSAAMDGGVNFIAHQLGIPNVFLWALDAAPYNPDDPKTWPKDLGPVRYQINEQCWDFDGRATAVGHQPKSSWPDVSLDRLVSGGRRHRRPYLTKIGGAAVHEPRTRQPGRIACSLPVWLTKEQR